jgi:MOSC domain-containing protein YiiM
MSGDKLIGTVIAVNVNPRSGIPKYHQERRVLVGECGLVGDYHNRPIRESFRNPGTFKKNLWHLSLLAQEVLGLLNQDTALEGMQVLLPGSLGENITVSHLGDLADVADGTIFAIGEHDAMQDYRRASSDDWEAPASG